MEKLILPDSSGAFANAGNTEFGVKLVNSKTAGCKLFLQGNGDHIIQMLYQSMESNETFARFMITSVLIFRERKKILSSDLHKHGFPGTPSQMLF